MRVVFTKSDLPLRLFTARGYPAQEIKTVRRMLYTVLTLSNKYQVERILAYANHLNGKCKAYEDMAAILTKHTGITTDRVIKRAGGNPLPIGDAPTDELIQQLADAKKEILEQWGFPDFVIKQKAKGFYAQGTIVHDETHAKMASCPNEDQAKRIAEALNEQEKAKWGS